MTRVERVYRYIWRYWNEHGDNPTHIEIMRSCRIRRDQLRSALAQLQESNVIKVCPGKHRGISIAQQQPAGDGFEEWQPAKRAPVVFPKDYVASRIVYRNLSTRRRRKRR